MDNEIHPALRYIPQTVAHSQLPLSRLTNTTAEPMQTAKQQNIMRFNKTIHRFLPALAAISLALTAAHAAIIITDTTVNTGTTGQDNSQVVTTWSSTQGSTPVDATNDLLMNHATVSISAPKLGLGDSLSAINDGFMLSGGHTSSQTDGITTPSTPKSRPMPPFPSQPRPC